MQKFAIWSGTSGLVTLSTSVGMSRPPNASARPNCCSARTSVFVRPPCTIRPRSSCFPRQQFVEAVLDDVAARRRNAVLVLQLLMPEGDGRVRQPRIVKGGRLHHQRARGDGGRTVVARPEAATHMAGADAQFHQCGHVARFTERKAMLDQVHHAAEIGARVQQNHAGLERVGMRAFLDHAGPLAIVLAHHHQHAALHTRRRQVAQGVGRHVGADDRLPCHRAAQRVVDGRAEHRGRRRFVGTGLHVHAEFVHEALGLHQNVHQVRYRRPLVAAHIGHARLQQGLGDGQDALAVKGLAIAQAQGLNFLAE
jgi:hypothetical protein